MFLWHLLDPLSTPGRIKIGLVALVLSRRAQGRRGIAVPVHAKQGEIQQNGIELVFTQVKRIRAVVKNGLDSGKSLISRGYSQR